MQFTDFFDLELGPIRDQWKRPMLIPRGGTEADRQAYTRMSSLADVIEDFSHLQTWQQRYLCLAMAQNMDLVRLAASETYNTGLDMDSASKEAKLANKQSGKRLDEIIERALDRRLINEKADYGTAIHARTEPGNTGSDPDEKQRIEVDSFNQLCRDAGIVHLGTEIFVANDELRSSGTFDNLSYIPGIGICVTDKKTSSKASATYDVQISGYANSEIYDVQTDERTTLEEYVSSKGWNPALIRRDIGFLFWVKNGRTQLRRLDLADGYENAILCARIRDGHRKKGVAPDFTKNALEEAANQRLRLLAALNGAPSRQHLNMIIQSPMTAAIWTEEHAAALNARWELVQ